MCFVAHHGSYLRKCGCFDGERLLELIPSIELISPFQMRATFQCIQLNWRWNAFHSMIIWWNYRISIKKFQQRMSCDFLPPLLRFHPTRDTLEMRKKWNIMNANGPEAIFGFAVSEIITITVALWVCMCINNKSSQSMECVCMQTQCKFIEWKGE